jgi:hypothetical protein
LEAHCLSALPTKFQFIEVFCIGKEEMDMEEGSRLQEVTLKLLSQVETVLDEGSAGLSELKQVAAVLKDVRDIQKEAGAVQGSGGGFRVILEGEVAGYGG